MSQTNSSNKMADQISQQELQHLITVSRLLMRLTDVQLAFPTLLLALAVIGFVGPGLSTVIVVLGITGARCPI